MDLAGAEVVAFGDENNDAGLFALADRSVAVGNAISTLKEGATEVIGSTPGPFPLVSFPYFVCRCSFIFAITSSSSADELTISANAATDMLTSSRKLWSAPHGNM